MKFEITATIPVMQYGNIQPKIEVEAETYEDARDIALNRINEIWELYGERPLEKKKIGSFVQYETFTGEKILYNDTTHEYTSLDGKSLLSGSAYARQLEEPFDVDRLSAAVAKKTGVDQKKIIDMWNDNGYLSRTFGTAIHKAVENWFRHKGNNTEYHKSSHPLLNKIVDSYPRKESTILPEEIVSSVKLGRVGRIDGIEIIGEKKCNIIDIKSDSKIDKNTEKHAHQLSFYASILEDHGWTVEHLYIDNYVEEWKTFEVNKRVIS